MKNKLFSKQMNFYLVKKLSYLFLILAIISCTNEAPNINSLRGTAIGTTYSIRYIDDSGMKFQTKIDSLINAVNRSTSTYISSSDISRINSGDTTVIVDEIFSEVFYKSEKIYKETDGVFDPTIGILVNAWGFGPETSMKDIDSSKIKSLLKYVGFNRVQLKKGKVEKQYPEIYFDFNAIGKGYLVDVVGRMFEKHHIKNYMVEIGGEIRARGVNEKQIPWRIAIENPNFDGSRSFATTVQLYNESIATSGNYRKFRTSPSGKKYVHTINAKTGFATESDLLSASVISKSDCADVDGYATAFMAMGYKNTLTFLEQHRELKAFLIYLDVNGEMKTYKTPNFTE